jgi:hypothetical protein
VVIVFVMDLAVGKPCVLVVGRARPALRSPNPRYLGRASSPKTSQYCCATMGGHPNDIFSPLQDLDFAHFLPPSLVIEKNGARIGTGYMPLTQIPFR